jgi:hypothetical protein
MLHKRIKPGGLIRICDSNFGSFSVRRNGLLHYYFTPPNLNHFTRETLSKMLLKAGFSEIVSYREARIAPYIFFDRTSSRCRYLDGQSLQPAVNFPPNSFFKKVLTSPTAGKSFNAIRRMLVNLGFSFIERIGLGDELQMIARK